MKLPDVEEKNHIFEKQSRDVVMKHPYEEEKKKIWKEIKASGNETFSWGKKNCLCKKKIIWRKKYIFGEGLLPAGQVFPSHLAHPVGRDILLFKVIIKKFKMNHGSKSTVRYCDLHAMIKQQMPKLGVPRNFVSKTRS